MAGSGGGGRQTQEVTQVKRRVVARRGTGGWWRRDESGMAGPRFGIADEGAGRGRNAVTRNVRVTREVALIISYPELHFPLG